MKTIENSDQFRCWFSVLFGVALFFPMRSMEMRTTRDKHQTTCSTKHSQLFAGSSSGDERDGEGEWNPNQRKEVFNNPTECVWFKCLSIYQLTVLTCVFIFRAYLLLSVPLNENPFWWSHRLNARVCVCFWIRCVFIGYFSLSLSLQFCMWKRSKLYWFNACSLVGRPVYGWKKNSLCYAFNRRWC